MADLDEAGAHYRACKQATLDARKRWAETEQEWAATCTPANPHGDRSMAAAVTEAFEDVQFCKACEVAAGEDFKGEPFGDVTARHENGGRPTGGVGVGV